MTDADFGKEIDRWILRSPPDDDPDYIQGRNNHEAMEAYYTPRVVTDFTNQRFKPGEKVKWLDPEGRQCKGVIVGATQTDAAGWPEYVVLQDKSIVQVDEMMLAYGCTSEGDDTPEPRPDDIPF